MGFKENFNNWPLGRQLFVLFIITASFLSVVLIVITKYQLDWILNKTLDSSNQTVYNRFMAQMKAIGKVEGKHMKSILNNYVTTVNHQKEVDQLFSGFYPGKFKGNPFVKGAVYSNQNAPKAGTYDYSGYYSRFSPISDNGMNIIKAKSTFNYIYPYMLSGDFYRMYQGYATEEIIITYPAAPIDFSFNPLVREWYYRANQSQGSVIITEPYLDILTEGWIISISVAMTNDKNNVYGVAAIDSTLNTLTEDAINIKVKNGFSMVLSAQGTILTTPSTWYQPNANGVIRIYDTVYTGITLSQWNDINNSTLDTVHTFTDPNGTEFFMIKYDIDAFYDDYLPVINLSNKSSSNITQYLLVCVPSSDVFFVKSEIEKSFDETYKAIFWVSVSTAIIVFLVIVILNIFLIRTSSTQLKAIEITFGNLVKKGLHPVVTEGIDLSRLEEISDGIENLIEACNTKIGEIDKQENRFKHYCWDGTRPSDCLVYENWSQQLYPFNYFSGKDLEWKKILPNLNRALV